MNTNDTLLKTALAALFVLAGSQNVFAKQSCDNSSFSGRYVVLAGGDVISVPNFPVGPFSRMALLIADGRGGISVPFAQSNYFGVPFPEPFTGSYSVNPDCTVDFIFDVPPPVSTKLTWSGVLFDKNDQLEMILTGFFAGTTGGGAAGAAMRKQTAQKCSRSDFEAGYELTMDGVVLFPPPPGFPPIPPPPFPLGRFFRVGRVVSDGAGAFTAKFTTSYNGSIRIENVSGTYTVDSELCKITMIYPMGGVPIVTEGLMIDKSTVNLILDTPGTNVRGTMNSQRIEE